jgi:hypothetical protein
VSCMETSEQLQGGITRMASLGWPLGHRGMSILNTPKESRGVANKASEPFLKPGCDSDQPIELGPLEVQSPTPLFSGRDGRSRHGGASCGVTESTKAACSWWNSH